MSSEAQRREHKVQAARDAFRDEQRREQARVEECQRELQRREQAIEQVGLIVLYCKVLSISSRAYFYSF